MSYQHGLDRGMLYPPTGPGIPWDGLISVDEQEDSSVRTRYFDGEAYRQSRPPGTFSAGISVITYPEGFKPMRGQQGMFRSQERIRFGMSYRVKTEHGYLIHLVYNCTVAPASVNYKTHGDTPDPTIFDWTVTTQPMDVPGDRQASHIIIDSTKVYDWVLEGLEALLYGNENTIPQLPTPTEILELIEHTAILTITDNGDGTWEAEGPDDVVYMVDDSTFEIDWISAEYIDDVTYTVQTW